MMYQFQLEGRSGKKGGLPFAGTATGRKSGLIALRVAVLKQAQLFRAARRRTALHNDEAEVIGDERGAGQVVLHRIDVHLVAQLRLRQALHLRARQNSVPMAVPRDVEVLLGARQPAEITAPASHVVWWLSLPREHATAAQNKHKRGAQYVQSAHPVDGNERVVPWLPDELGQLLLTPLRRRQLSCLVSVIMRLRCITLSNWQEAQ